MYERAASLKDSPAVTRMLVRALEHEKTVDLAPFTHLGTAILASTVGELQKHGRMTGINLSNCYVKKDDLMEIWPPARL